jgi:hypothetical protein
VGGAKDGTNFSVHLSVHLADILKYGRRQSNDLFFFISSQRNGHVYMMLYDTPWS